MNKKFFLCFAFIFLISFLSKPLLVDAAFLYVEQSFNEIKIGEKNILEIYLNTENEKINVLEGNFKIIGPVEVLSIDTKNSIFSIWPDKPAIIGQEISFVGGTPGKVSGSSLQVFELSIIPQSAGTISFISNNLTAYLSDGLGTKLSVAPFNFEIKIGEKEIKISEQVAQKEQKNYNLVYLLIILSVLVFVIFLKIKNKK